MNWFENADLILKVTGLIGAAVAFIAGFRQYVKAQSWQRASVVLTLIESFNADSEVQMASEMLDWDERIIKVDGNTVLHFKNEMLKGALKVVPMDIAPIDGRTLQNDIVGATEFSKDEMIIRDAFDSFFDFFDKLDSFIESGLLKFSDCQYFNYWFEIIRDLGKYKGDSQLTHIINTYVQMYQFYGIQDLLNRYARSSKPFEFIKPRL